MRVCWVRFCYICETYMYVSAFHALYVGRTCVCDLCVFDNVDHAFCRCL